MVVNYKKKKVENLIFLLQYLFKLVYGAVLNKWLFCANLHFSHTSVLFFNDGQFPQDQATTTLDSASMLKILVEDLLENMAHKAVGKYWLCRTKRQVCALSLRIYLTFAIVRLAIRLSSITPRNHLCVRSVGYVRWKHSCRLCRDKML